LHNTFNFIAPDPVREFREIKRKLKQDHYFQANPLFYIGIGLLEVSLWSAAVFVVSQFPRQQWAQVVGAVLVALFWLQLGWFGHDVHHNQVS
jgi:hypothetical protein